MENAEPIVSFILMILMNKLKTTKSKPKEAKNIDSLSN